MDFFMTLISERVEPDNVLRKVERLIDWRRVGWKVGNARSRPGRAGHDVDLMVRVLLPGQWHSLSDRQLEQALKVRLDFMLFRVASVLKHSPDHTTICRFRNALVKLGLHGALLEEVGRQLTVQGLKVAGAPAAVVDATVIESAACPERMIEGAAVDRAEDGATDVDTYEGVTERLSVDPDARWLKKGGKSYFGYKGFWRADGEGDVERVMARPANEGEAPHLKTMLAGCTAALPLADKAYSSAANREMLARAGLKSGIMFRASRGCPLTFWQKTFNKLDAKRRWIVEQGFGTLKRLFHGARSRCMTGGKVEAELTFKGTAMNPLKAANRIGLAGA